MHKERLLKLAELLENLPKGRPKFDLGVWYKCGTTACAIGHAALHPWFKRRGLKLTKDPYEMAGTHHPTCKDSEGIDAACEFFDLYESEAERLFYPESYPQGRRGPRSVAKRIRRFVEKGDA